MLTRRQLLLSTALLPVLPSSSLVQAETPEPQSSLVIEEVIKKVIPSSGEKIPVIGIGTNRYGVGDDEQALTNLKATLKRYAQMGGGLIDTAPAYGSSEQVLGKLIHELGLSEAFFMATKCDERGGQATRDQLASSTQKLQSGTLDLVSVHNIRNWQAQLPVLREAKQAGTIRYYGVTTSRDHQYEAFGNIMASAKLDFVQVNYSLGDRGVDDRILQIAADKGIAVMVNLAFGRGKLFSAVKGLTLPAWAAEFDANSWGQFFLKYVVSHPAVTCAIPGTTKVHHLEDNLGAAMGRLPSPEQRVEMEAFFDAL